MQHIKKSTQKLNIEMISIIMTLAWPTMLEQLMQTAVQYIDTAMVGALGTQATAAVGATSTVNWLIGSSISALSVGFLSFIARACGANNEEAAKKSVSQAVLAVLVTGILFTILTLALSRYVPVWMQVDKNIQDLAAQYFFILYIPMQGAYLEKCHRLPSFQEPPHSTWYEVRRGAGWNARCPESADLPP